MQPQGTARLQTGWADVRPGVWLAGGLVLVFLLLFFALPVARVFITAFLDGDNSFTLGHFSAFFSQDLMRESFMNSLYVAVMSAIFAALIAVPLAYFTVRFDFRGALLIQTLGVLPLIMPPFVGAVALQLIFGRSGTLNLLLNDAFGFTLPIMEGLNGVIFVEAIHYFPFILMNLTVALRNIDGAMEEAAMNLGCKGWRLFWRVIFPLGLPGFVAGASLVFVKVFDDLGTPLVMGQTNMLAPQAYLRITQVGLEDPMGYVISVLMIVFSIGAMVISARALKGRDFSTLQKGGASIQRRQLSPFESALAYLWIGVILLITLSPHLGVLLLSFAKVWSFSPLPDAYTLEHYATVFQDASGMIQNTLLYCGLAAGCHHRLFDLAHPIACSPMAGLDCHSIAGSAWHCVGNWFLAHVQRCHGAWNRCLAHGYLGGHHVGLCGTPIALCLAQLHGRVATSPHLPRRSRRKCGCQQNAQHSKGTGATDDGWYLGRVCHKFHHSRCRVVGHHHAGIGRLASAYELRYLFVHAKCGGSWTRRGPRCIGHLGGGHWHLFVTPRG